MAKKNYFEGATIEELPYLPKTAFADLEKGTIIVGVVDYAMTFKAWIKIGVAINGYTTQVTLWNHTIEQARLMVGAKVKLKFNGLNDAGYPDLYLRY